MIRDERGQENLFCRLVDIVLPRGGYVMALCEAYLDESYTDSGVPIWSVGGYVFRSDAAIQADAEWRQVLAEFDVPYFHMVDVAPCNGIYKKLGMDGCDQMARRMIDIIKRHMLVGGAAIINPNECVPRQGLVHGKPVPITGFSDDAYTNCVQISVFGLGDWVRRWADPDPRIAFFLESGHGTGHLASEVLTGRIAGEMSPLYKSWYVSHTFAKKAEIPLLQAADLLMWQVTKYLKDLMTNARRPRADFRSLMERNHTFYYAHQTDTVSGFGAQKFPAMGPAANKNLMHPEIEANLRRMFRVRR